MTCLHDLVYSNQKFQADNEILPSCHFLFRKDRSSCGGGVATTCIIYMNCKKRDVQMIVHYLAFTVRSCIDCKD